MTETEIKEKINEFLVSEFEVDAEKIVPSANLRETLDLDSLDYVDLVVIIEEKFGFKVVAEDFINIHSFDDFYNYVNGKVASMGALKE
jgi:acyl carrier protein